jgi:uncharacterized membrane protein
MLTYFIAIVMLMITTLLGVVAYFLKRHFDKVDSMDKGIHEINATLTAFKIDLIIKEKRLEVVERNYERIKVK